MSTIYFSIPHFLTSAAKRPSPSPVTNVQFQRIQVSLPAVWSAPEIPLVLGLIVEGVRGRKRGERDRYEHLVCLRTYKNNVHDILLIMGTFGMAGFN